MVCCDMMMAE